MNENDLLDIYTDYLISSFGLTTATGLWQMLNDAFSHGRIQCFLSSSPQDRERPMVGGEMMFVVHDLKRHFVMLQKIIARSH